MLRSLVFVIDVPAERSKKRKGNSGRGMEDLVFDSACGLFFIADRAITTRDRCDCAIDFDAAFTRRRRIDQMAEAQI
jgi:hypothetical protein